MSSESPVWTISCIPIPGEHVPVYLKSGAQYGPDHNIGAATATAFLGRHAPFRAWYTKMISEFGSRFKSVKILEIRPFVLSRGLGFVLVDAEVYNEGGLRLPGVAFLRGGSVAILLELICAHRHYIVTTVQARIPGSSAAYEEIPAGMMDGDMNFRGVAANEIAEEVGITIEPYELITLGTMEPSIGGCDEEIRLFQVKQEITPEHLDRLRGSLTGCLAEGEAITLRIREKADFLTALSRGEIKDAKAMCAVFHSQNPLRMC
jgi:8-oxo-dGTP pyrophosphatase MutT (NUDIX family)